MFTVSMKIATFKILLHKDIWPAGWPDTDHYVDSYFSYKSIKLQSDS